MPMATEHYFYHSFPRRSDPSGRHDLGLRILESIARDGLLLTPEEVTWLDPLDAGADSRVHAYQRRVCFTQLSPDELPAHEQVFGAFSLEFGVEELRTMGAMPVIYVPDAVGAAASLAVLPTALLAHVAVASAAFDALNQVKVFPGPGFEADVRIKGTDQIITHSFSQIELQAIQRYIRVLEQYQKVDLTQSANAMRSLSSIFYPTENMHYNDTLYYYRQREWRIFSDIYWDSLPNSTPANQAQIDNLIGIDPEFFGRSLEFPGGAGTRAEKCHFLSKVMGSPLSAFVRRVIVPEDAVQSAKAILEKYDFRAELVGIRRETTL